MTPEQIKEMVKKRRRRARYRFRTLIRRVVFNLQWLSELEETKIGENVRRNVQIIVRRKGRKGLLSLMDKRILNTPFEDRTEEERRNILAVITNLKALARYPPRIRSRIAKVCHYMYFNRGRTIIKEGQYPSALYFILDGEITVYQREYDPVEKIYVNKAVGAMGPGDMFGEVALLYNMTRTATCVTAMNCEFLCIFREDFDLVLRETLQTQWDQILTAIDRFEYFKLWTPKQIQQCCVVSRIKQYSPQQLIYSEDKGVLNYAHFVLSGQCMILQCLKMRRHKSTNEKFVYELIDATDDMSGHKPQRKYTSNAENPEALMRQITSLETLDALPYEILENAARYSSQPIDTPSAKIFEKSISDDIIHRFVDVGTLSCGSVFALGETMEHRAIIARNTVQCLLIPRYWLLQKLQNMGNVWYRTKMYIESSVPSREQLYEDFLQTMKWLKFRKDLVEVVTRTQTSYNTTTVDDVPMICRIEENLLDT